MTDRTRWWVEALGHWGLAWALVVLFVGGWILLCRPRRAVVRYVGWLLATFAGLALLPAIAGVVPRVSWRDARDRFLTGPTGSHRAGRPPRFRSWFENMAGGMEAGPIEPAPPRSIATDLTRADRAQAMPTGRGSLEARPFGDRWMKIALAVWLAGTSLFLVRLARAVARVRRLIAECIPATTGELTAEAELVRSTLGVHRRVRVLVHPEIATPMCVGLFHPVILWSAAENCPMTPLQRRAALVHEVAHLLHLDDWIALVAEIWRGLTWFFLPVHWTLARLHLERECRCDDLAARELSDPNDYARWLLDLAPVRIALPLAAPLSGRSGLAARVRRIVRGELGWARPLGRRRVAALCLLGMLLLGAAGSVRLIGLVRAGEPADAPLPEITPKELATRLRHAWAGYDRGLLEVTFLTTTNTNWRFMMNQGKPEEQEPIFVHFPGRARFLSDGARWRAEYDSMMPTALSRKLSPYRWSSGFDGQQLYGWNISRNLVTLGEAEGGADRWKPEHQFWHEGASFAESLEKPPLAGDTLTIGQRTVEGVRCYVVERSFARWKQKTEEIVSPRQGYLILSTTWFSKGKPYHIHTLHGVHEVSPGIWAPADIVEESRDVHDDGKELLDHRTRIRVIAFDPKKTFAAEAFSFTPPPGVDVTDRRLGYSYHNDPWWPEAGKLLRERFDWPKSDLSPLKSLGSPAQFQAKSAPPITAAEWINSAPIDPAKLRGKVVLVEFWGTWCPPCREKIPALRTLYETYHPLGLEMISVHTPTKDVEAVRRFVREYRMPYPIAIDAEGENAGITSHAYGVTGYPCAFLLDHKGTVHTVGEARPDAGRLVETLIPLLEQAGAKNVRSISLELPRLSAAMEDAVKKALARWIEAAPRKGVIHGRIVDGQGQPIAGCKVAGTLKTTLLLSASPGGYQLLHPGPRFETSSGKDGRFQSTGLTRGTYALQVQATGRASRERDVFIGPDFQIQDVEFTLDQADAITGTVRDADGSPISGATVDAIDWHHVLPNGNDVVTRPSGAAAVQSDAAGHYRLQSLRQGSFSLKVTAPGYQDATMETVPAGTTGVDLTLTRSADHNGAAP